MVKFRYLFPLVILVLIVHVTVSAEVYFNETQPTTVEEKEYTIDKIKGEEVYKINVFPNDIYYVLVTKKDQTIITLPFTLVDVKSGNQAFAHVLWKKNDTEISLKPKTNIKVGDKMTLRIKAGNNFAATLLLKVVPYGQHNTLVNLIDGRINKNIRAYTKEAFLKMESELNSKLKKREQMLKRIYSDNFTIVPIGKTIRVNHSKLILQNLLVSGGRYSYTLEYQGENDITINKNDIFLYITNYNNFVLTEQQGDTTRYYPSEVLVFDEADNKHLFVVSFETNNSKNAKTFYFDLHISRDLIFSREKINLDLLATTKDSIFCSPVNDCTEDPFNDGQ